MSYHRIIDDEETNDVDPLADNKTTTNNRKQKLIPIWSLFRYATWFDTIILLFGTLMAIIAGCGFPGMIVVLGHAITEFNDYSVADRIRHADSEISYFCNDTQDTGIVDYLRTETPGDRLKNRITILSYISIGIAVTYFFASFTSKTIWPLSAIRQKHRIKIAFLKSVLKQDMGHYDLNPPTQLPSYLSSDIQKIEEGIGRNFSTFIQEMSSMVVSFIIAFIFNWQLALVTSVLLPVLLVMLGVLGKVASSVTIKEQNILASAASVAVEVLSSIKTVMAFAGQNKEIERYNGFLKKAHRQTYLKHCMFSFVFGCYNIIVFLYYAIGFWYGAHLLITCDNIEVGDIIIVVFEISGSSIALGYVVLPLTSIGIARGSATLVYTVIDQEPEIDRKNDASITPDFCEGNIEFSDVEFRYPSRPDVEILHGLNLSIKKGRTVALVGPSGSGKSTIVQLLLRMYDYSSGMISLDGTSIKDIDIGWLRNQIGIVSQEPVLFNVSIAENIRHGKEGATMEDIEKAATCANAHQFISELSHGYHSLVGEGGAQLSGGQKQRVAIARALVRDPKILLLDEATSALDKDSERVVQQALDKAREGRTTIVIAHRLSTIQTADVIVAIEQGNVVEMGSHSELMNKQGVYYALVMAQQTTDEEDTQDFHFQMLQTERRHRTESLRQETFSHPETSISREARVRSSTFQGVSDHHLNIQLPNFGTNIQDDVSRYSLFEDIEFAEPLITTSRTVHQASFKDLIWLSKPEWKLLIPGMISYSLVGILLSSIYILTSEALQPLSETDRDAVISGIRKYSIIFIGLGIIGFFLHLIGTMCLNLAADGLTKRLRSESFRTMLKQDMQFFDKPENSVSALVTDLVVDAQDINQVTGIALGFILRVTFTALASAIIALRASWVLALATLPFYPILLFSGFLQIRLTKTFAEKSKTSLDNSSRMATEAIDNVTTITSIGIGNRIVKQYDELLTESLSYSNKSTVLDALVFSFSQSFVYLVLAGAFTLGAVIFLKDEDDPYQAGYIHVFQGITAVFFTNVLFRDAFEALPDSQKAKLSASRITHLLSQQPNIDSFSTSGILPEHVGAGFLQLQSTKFSYPSRPAITVLDDLDISIKPGQTIAFVGPSGSGKSTIVSLVERFYDPTNGCVLLDGVDIRHLNIAWLRRQISLVSQEPVLFDMSIADNIRYGANYRDVSDEEVMDAAISANIHDFIELLPQGYNTIVGVKGTQLSGGQKQRVAIARALVRDPKILLLDEATSALDTESEKAVQEALDKAREGRTTIVIAHRLSTIYNADSIAVLHKGCVIEQGTHAELMSKHGAYYTVNSDIHRNVL